MHIHISFIPIQRLSGQSDVQRSQEVRKGYHTGLTAIHPLTGARLPVLIASYVLPNVGTGAVMGVPAHDKRDQVTTIQ